MHLRSRHSTTNKLEIARERRKKGREKKTIRLLLVCPVGTRQSVLA